MPGDTGGKIRLTKIIGTVYTVKSNFKGPKSAVYAKIYIYTALFLLYHLLGGGGITHMRSWIEISGVRLYKFIGVWMCVILLVPCPVEI